MKAKMFRKRGLALFAALIIGMSLFAGMPAMVQAVGAPIFVSIDSADSDADVQTNIQAAIDAADGGGGGVVNVTGEKTNVTDGLELDIPHGVTVLWNATYSGQKSGDWARFIWLNGKGGKGGAFEVANDGLIRATANGFALFVITAGESSDGAGTVDVTVSGGSVIADDSAFDHWGAIGICSDKGGSVTVSGGTVESIGESGSAIESINGNVAISGGTVKANGEGSETVYAECGDVTISGGLVRAEGFWSRVVYADDCTVDITGGSIESTGGRNQSVAVNSGNTSVTGGKISTDGPESVAINNEGDGLLEMTGGAVTASGKDCTAVAALVGDITVSGGTVKATGTGSAAIRLEDIGGRPHMAATAKADYPKVETKAAGLGGAIAYKKGLCTGKIVNKSKIGMIIEVDKLSIPVSRHNTSQGLTVKPGGHKGNTVKWNTAGERPLLVLNMAVAEVNSLAFDTKKLSWGTINTGITKIDTPRKSLYIQSGKSLVLPCVSYNGLAPKKETLTWKSSKPKIVKVSNTGKVTVPRKVKKGKAIITVTAKSGVKLDITVIVSPKAVKLKKAAVTAPKSLKKGSAKKLAIKVTPQKATTLKVTFKSSKSSGLSVDKAGNLMAKKKGTYTITIKVGSKTVKKKIKVT